MHQQMPDVFTNYGSSGFTGHHDFAMIDLLESIRQAANLGGFSTTLRTFEGNENAGFVTHDLGYLRFFEQSDNLVG